jgi:hypothetical protein
MSAGKHGPPAYLLDTGVIIAAQSPMTPIMRLPPRWTEQARLDSPVCWLA